MYTVGADQASSFASTLAFTIGVRQAREDKDCILYTIRATIGQWMVDMSEGMVIIGVGKPDYITDYRTRLYI